MDKNFSEREIMANSIRMKASQNRENMSRRGGYKSPSSVGNEEISGMFKIRLFASVLIFLFYLYMFFTGKEINGISCEQINEYISEEIVLNEGIFK